MVGKTTNKMNIPKGIYQNYDYTTSKINLYLAIFLKLKYYENNL